MPKYNSLLIYLGGGAPIVSKSLIHSYFTCVSKMICCVMIDIATRTENRQQECVVYYCFLHCNEPGVMPVVDQ